MAKSPAELNFYFGVNLTIELNETTYTVPIYLGQGHVVFDNNWWMGGFAITAGSLDGPAHLLVGGSSFPVIGRGFSAFIIEF